MKRLLGQRPEPEAKYAEEKEPIPQRWVIILVTSALGGVLVGNTVGALPWGLTTTIAIIGLLHSVMR
jgi:hypothetical protein